MKQFLDARIAFVSLIFSAFGSALTRIFLVDASHIGWDVTGFASLLALVASLLISVFFIRKNKKFVVARRYILLSLFVGACILYFNRINKLVCDEKVKVLNSRGNDSTYTIQIIPGNQLIDTNDPVLNRVNASALKCSLCDSLATHEPTNIWTTDSIKSAENQITYSYIFLVVLLVALLTHLSEELFRRGKNDASAKKESSGP